MRRIRWRSIAPQGEAFHLVRARLRGHQAVREHLQDFPEVFWIEEGRALHAVSGVRIALERGDLTFFRSNDRHSLSALDKTGFVLVNIAFSAETLDFLRQRYFASEDRWFWHTGPEPEKMSLPPGRLRWLARWVNRLDSSECSRLEIELFLLELLRDLRKEPPSRPATGEPDWLAEVFQHLPDPEILAGGTRALARRTGRTPQHVNAVLKRYRGITATEALNGARMEFAARELRTSTKKILEICFDCGFQNVAHFYRVFGQFSGLTPRAYRLGHQQSLR